MTAAIPHVFLTRFNLPANRVERSIFSSEWLTDRMRLFEAYTVPSVRSQEESEVSWIVYLDQEHSPQWLRTRMEELSVELPLHPIYLDGPLDREILRSHVMRVTQRSQGKVVTSNLDNDDGLAVDFVRRVGELVPDSVPAVICLMDGLILNHDRVYRRRDRDNALSAVVDDVASTSFFTCWAGVHHQLDLLMPAVRAGGKPAWLQVVHGRNVSNRVGGRLAEPSMFVGAFPGLIDDLPKLTLRKRIGDALASPGRLTRDRAVRPGAAIARRIIGQDRYETLKMKIQGLV